MSQKQLLSAEDLRIILFRLACQLKETHGDFSKTWVKKCKSYGLSCAIRCTNHGNGCLFVCVWVEACALYQDQTDDLSLAYLKALKEAGKLTRSGFRKRSKSKSYSMGSMFVIFRLYRIAVGS